MLMSDGSVRNSFTLKLRNMESRPRAFEIALDGLPGAVMWGDEESRDDAARALRIQVAPDETRTVRAYIIAPPETRSQEFRFRLRSLDKEGASDETQTQFAAPGSDGT
jgi:hypothetical protein